MTKHLQAGLLAVAFATWVGTTTAQEIGASPAVQHYESVPYLTGGIGETERASILAASERFNLKLLFAEKGGAYLAGVTVVVTDMAGATVLALRSDGPLVLANLSPGNYRISAEVDGQEQSRTFSIPSSGQRSLVFYW
jgi:hypothetical protein